MVPSNQLGLPNKESAIGQRPKSVVMRSDSPHELHGPAGPEPANAFVIPALGRLGCVQLPGPTVMLLGVTPFSQLRISVLQVPSPMCEITQVALLLAAAGGIRAAWVQQQYPSCSTSAKRYGPIGLSATARMQRAFPARQASIPQLCVSPT